MKSECQIGVVDYGMGNLHSVAKALAQSGHPVLVSDNKTKLKNSDILVLPGVGSFGAAMKNLAQKKLDEFIQRWIFEGKPYLGICLGLQLLFPRSEEDPRSRGLGVFPGRVERFRVKNFKREPFCVPHMGWNELKFSQKKEISLLKKIPAQSRFYFVHTYFPVPAKKEIIFSTTNYGSEFCSSVFHKNVFATQFHPEKSGLVGLQLLKNVIAHYHKGIGS